MYYVRRKEAGLCVSCGAKVEIGQALCVKCRIQNNAYQRTRTRGRKDAGICTKCGRISVAGTGYKMCPVCREKAASVARERYAKARAAKQLNTTAEA